jgi:hypothetical protein
MSRKTTRAGKTPARRPLPGQTRPADFGRHVRKCCVCRHPRRRAIEAAFLHWRSPDIVADQYDLCDRKSVYRHAHATGLWARRKRNLRFALETIIEHASEVTVTAGAVITAVRAYTHINDAGEWVEPPPSSRSPLVTHPSSLRSSNRDTEELENGPTH